MTMSTRRRVRGGSAVVLAVAALVLAACSRSSNSGSTTSTPAGGGGASSSGATNSTKSVAIAFLPLVQANPYIQATYDGLKAAAAKAGNVTVTEFDANLDGTKQAQQCQDAVTSGKYQAIVTVPVNPTNLTPCVKAAIAKGIKFGNTDFPLGPDPSSGKPQFAGQVVSVLDPSTTRGDWIFQLIQQACVNVNPCKTALITGVLADPYSAAVNKVVTDKASATSNIKIVATREGFYLPNTTLPVVQDILQANSDLSVIATTSDPMTVGAAQALAKAGKTGQVKLIGGGYSSAAPTQIASGAWIGTFLSAPYDEGQIAGEYVIKAARGDSVTGVGISASVQTGLPTVITKDNIAKLAGFKPQWQGL